MTVSSMDLMTYLKFFDMSPPKFKAVTTAVFLKTVGTDEKHTWLGKVFVIKGDPDNNEPPYQDFAIAQVYNGKVIFDSMRQGMSAHDKNKILFILVRYG